MSTLVSASINGQGSPSPLALWGLWSGLKPCTPPWLAGTLSLVCGWLAYSYRTARLLGYGMIQVSALCGVDLGSAVVLLGAICRGFWRPLGPILHAADYSLGNSVGAIGWSSASLASSLAFGWVRPLGRSPTLVANAPPPLGGLPGKPSRARSDSGRLPG